MISQEYGFKGVSYKLLWESYKILNTSTSCNCNEICPFDFGF